MPHRLRIGILTKAETVFFLLELHAQRSSRLLHHSPALCAMHEPRDLTAVSGNECECHSYSWRVTNVGGAKESLRRSRDDLSQSGRAAHKCGSTRVLDQEDAGAGIRYARYNYGCHAEERVP